MRQEDSSANGTWVQVEPRRASGKPRRIEIRFYPEYIRAIWARRAERALSATRGGVSLSPDSETLLLHTAFPVDGVTVFVRAWFIPAPGKRDTFHLRVEIGAPEGVKRAIRVILRWDNAEYIAPLRAGQVSFEDITAPDFSKSRKNLPSRRLQLSFEFEDDDKHTKPGKRQGI